MPPKSEKESGAASTPEMGNPVAPPVSAKSAAQLEKMALMLRQLWQKNLPELRGRLDQFNAAAAAAENGDLTEEMRAQTESTAHKLAGALGTFGYTEGTRLARLLEGALAKGEPADPVRLRTLANDLRAALSIDPVNE